MSSKVDFINSAFSRCRISGLTKQPSPEDLELALKRLENMAAGWEEKNISTGYAFENQPDPNTPHNVPRAYWDAFESNLAMKILADFGKAPQPTLVGEAQGTLSNLYSSTAQVKRVDYSPRMARGSGNTLKTHRWYRFYHGEERAPISESTIQMFVDDIDDFVENFGAFLDLGETISSFTVSSDANITVVSSSLSSPDVSYRVQADKEGVFQIKIVATSSTGRVITRINNFNIVSSEI